VRIALVVQRYGADLLGGAERHAALMAGLLARHHEVEVLTTTAGDYQSWSPAYPAGESRVAGVLVRRFPVEVGRSPDWPALSDRLHRGFAASDFARLTPAERDAFSARVRAWPQPLQEEFIRGQGPIAPALIDHLARGGYDRFLFVTYLYPTTYDGLAVVDADRARVVPTLHDEPAAYLPVFGQRFARSTLLCSTEAEVRLVARLYPDRPPAARLLGYGVAPPTDAPSDPDRSRPFLLYAGRIDPQKGIEELLSWYRVLRRIDPHPPRLVLTGETSMPLSAEPGVETRGFVDDDEKLHLMRRALALVHPSPFESLGIVLLEALAVRTPVIVNARCEVLVEHCRRGRSGLWVRDGAELGAAVRRLRTTPQLRDDLGAAGRAYVEREYSLAAYERALLREFPA